MTTKLQLQPTSSEILASDDIDLCTAIAWLELVAGPDDVNGDEWLHLCGNIDEGEIYRDWFIWHDAEVSQEWEGYDIITNDRVVAANLAQLQATIDGVIFRRTVLVPELARGKNA